MKTLNYELLGYDSILDEAARSGTTPAPRDIAQASAQEQLENFATALLLDKSSTRFIIDQIAEDHYISFIWWMWPDTTTDTAPATDDGAADSSVAPDGHSDHDPANPQLENQPA
jgi:hypothetical protein